MHNKFLILILIMFCSAVRMRAQSDTSLQPVPGNSFQETYKTKYPGLNYTYDSLSQTHNYADNWDFDGDGQKDKLLFIGNGGAHLYFHLQLTLSTNKKTYAFTFLEIDFPFFNDRLTLDNKGRPNIMQQFVVADFDADQLPEIYISLDAESIIPRKWKDKVLHAHQVIVDYSNGRLELKNYHLGSTKKG